MENDTYQGTRLVPVFVGFVQLYNKNKGMKRLLMIAVLQESLKIGNMT